MPAVRSAEVRECKGIPFTPRTYVIFFIGFQDIHKSGRVKCLPCSEHFQSDKEITRTSISKHKASNAHKTALASSSNFASKYGSNPPTSDINPAVLLVAEEFTLSDSESQTGDSEMRMSEFFDRVAVYDDIIIGEDGNEILFSAGVLPIDNSREVIKRQIHALKYNCASLGQMAFEDNNLYLDDGADCTVSNVVAGLREMGKYQCT